jgi:hypothetical protein
MKCLVPMARANRAACVKLVEGLGKQRPTSRQIAALYGAWQSGDQGLRERLLTNPWLFLKAQEEVQRADTAKPPGRQLLGDLGALGGISRRVMSRLREGIIRQLQPGERSEVTLCLAQAKADTESLFHLFEKELGNAHSEPANSHP